MSETSRPQLRPFAPATDFPQMAEVANASFAADGMKIIRRPEEIRRDYASFRGFDPLRDIRMAERHGALAGYVRTTDWTTTDGAFVQGQIAFVHPRHRGHGVGRLLLAWVEERQREIARRHPEASAWFHHAFVTEGERDRARLLTRAGYRATRHFHLMERPDLDAIPDFPLPPGFELRPVRTEDLRAIFDAHMAAIAGLWGVAPAQPGDFEAWTKQRTFQPELWQVAWDVASNQVAGQVKPFIDHEQNAALGRLRGYTEFISVGEPWRRRGLARALVVRALHALRDAGMRDSALGVDSDNPDQAPRLYEACGFRVVRQDAVYRKPLALRV